VLHDHRANALRLVIASDSPPAKARARPPSGAEVFEGGRLWAPVVLGDIDVDGRGGSVPGLQ